MGAVVVVDDDLPARPRRAREQVPARGRELGARIEETQIGRAAGRDHHDVGRFRERVVRAGETVEAEGDAEPFALGDAPVDDAEDLAPSP